MTQTQQKEQKVTYNPNPTYQSLTETEALNADLEEARMQIATIKKERDTLANTLSERDKAIDSMTQSSEEMRLMIGKLDKEQAQLKDSYQSEQKKNENMFRSFEELYNKYLGLYEQISSTIAANSITTGKLAEALVRHKFTIPEAQQQ